MNKRLLISIVVMFVMLMVLGFLVHGLILRPEYAKLPNIFRDDTDSMRKMGFLILGQFIAACAFAWIYQRGKEAKPFLAQGIRYGIAIAAVMIVSKFLIYYAVTRMPYMLVLKQIVLDSIGAVLMGIVVAKINE
jgi:hypothetical protein